MPSPTDVNDKAVLATRIQACFRGLSLRRRMKLARFVQRLYRGHVARQRLKRVPKRTLCALQACERAAKVARCAADFAQVSVASLNV